ncbi:MAG: phenylalanine--tRNA ligase subunit beta, partial [Deltaproteobacteria bacterium]|nr:phenylalanine--tRNA ligase subunit beta [Deltaproteobacteria bacterium]
IRTTLSNLGIKTLNQTAESIEVVIPPHRYDISAEEDIIEEIARIYGYNNFGITLPHTETFDTSMNIRDRFLRTVTHLLSDYGLNEVLNYTFIS